MVARSVRFAASWAPRHVSSGTTIIRQQEPAANEIIVLSGCLASSIYDPDGNEICVGLHVGPCVVAPTIARTRDGASRVAIEAITHASIVQIDAAKLTDLMIASEPLRTWANAILRAELGHKADREWCLAALGGADRLGWFRDRFPGYEDIFSHARIASFLGMTPVTLSRLRRKDRQSAPPPPGGTGR